jgi:hypothetical protein
MRNTGRRPMSGTLKEFDAYGSILNNLKSLAQDLKTKDPGEFQVVESIRTHLLEMLDSLMGGQDQMHSGMA